MIVMRLPSLATTFQSIRTRARCTRHYVRFCLYLFALIGPSIAGFIAFASVMRVEPLNFQAPLQSTPDATSADIELTAEIVAVDPLTRTLTMNWYPTLLIDLNCAPSMSITDTLDIFMPIGLFSNGDPSTSLDADDKLVYRFNLTKQCGGVNPSSSFSTITNIASSKKIIKEVSQRATLQSYPFDVYLAQLVMYSRNISEPESSGKAVRITDSFGIAVNFDVSLVTTFIIGGQSGTSQQLLVDLQIQRSIVTKIFVVVVGVVNWITAVAFLTISAATIVYRSASIYSEMFVVPIGTLFAFTSIRANLPGAPSGFGTTIGASGSVLGIPYMINLPTLTDIYTILPVLIIMSSCSVGLLLTILYLRVRANITSIFGIAAEDPTFGQKTEERISANTYTYTASFGIQPTRQDGLHLETSARIYAASFDQVGQEAEEKIINRVRTNCTV